MQNSAIVSHIVDWLKSYALQANSKGFVVGISGGIDSALTSSLCALTGLKTVLVEMPIHQSQDQVSRGALHIENLKNAHPNVSNQIVDLTPTYDQLLGTLKPQLALSPNTETTHLTLGNTRARLRMTTLYAVAGIEGCLVAGTGNKIEDFGVGFFTKYGDGGVDLSPIADLTKSEVYALAAHLGVNERIQNAAPTDGLWDDGRTDEDQIGATYAELEAAMKIQEAYGNQPPEHVFTHKRSKEVWHIYLGRWKANQHKMNPIPVCIIPKEFK